MRLPCGDIVDPATGLPRVLAEMCPTCIYRPGNLMHLDAGRRQSLQGEAVTNGSWIICHSTLPYYRPGSVEQAICRGFYAVASDQSEGIAFVRRVAKESGVDWPACSAFTLPTEGEV